MTPRVVVVGLGPGDPGLVTVQTASAIAAIGTRFARTSRHPSVPLLGDAATFDEVYESAGSLDDVYPEIVERLVAAAVEHGEVLYAVPGSPLVAERTVELLRADGRVEVEIHPAMSFLDLVWHRLGVDPVASGVQLVDGQRFAVEAAGLPGPLLVSQCDSSRVLSDIKLALDWFPGATAGPELLSSPEPLSSPEVLSGPEVTVLARLGLPDESITVVAWDDLDRLVEPDHLTTLWIPSLAAPVAAEFVRLDELMRILREHCPWDRRQTHQSLTRHLLEETYEVLEAIDGLEGAGIAAEEAWSHLEEELGDLLFQVVFHATLAAEEGQFTLADVARGIHDKLVSRHPHVFASGATPDVFAPGATPDVFASGATPAAGQRGGTSAAWENSKRAEKGRVSAMDGITPILPALAYAAKVQSRAASAGFDWDDVEGALPKIDEELAELAQARRSGAPAAVADELGDVLFAVVNVARHLDIDPEAALRHAAAKFSGRFRAVEASAVARGLDMAASDLVTLDRLWDEVKVTGDTNREWRE